MIHYVYEITNNINGKIYVGVHSTKDVNDGYMGSGKHLKQAIIKYGIDNFTKRIIEFYPNADECYAAERDIVNAEFVMRSDTYNLKIGGEGGWDHITKSSSFSEQCSNAAIAGNTIRWKNEDWSRAQRAKISKRLVEEHSSGKRDLTNFTQSFAGKKHTEETKNKIGAKVSKHQTGSGNSNFGKKWMHSLALKMSKPVKAEDIDKYIADGWIIGRKIKF